MMLARVALGLVTFTLSLFSAALSVAQPVEFVVLGDIPYGKDQIGSVKFIGKAIRKAGFPFVIHYGDLKSGGSPCDDSLLSERRDLLAKIVEGGLFYTPGDNDWTDCDRPGAGGYDELERLKKIRSLFFSQNLMLKPEWQTARQSPDYPENARWVFGNLQFVTLHIVGTDNGRQEILKTDPAAKALDAVDARDRANLVWLEAAFDNARQHGLDGLIVAMQADPFDIADHAQRNRPCSQTERTACNPYLPFLQNLTRLADLFDRPVLLVHGSTSNFCIDRGFGGWRARKLWRLNGPGDFVYVDAAVVRFDPDDVNPFQVRSLSTEDPVSPCRLRDKAK